MFYKINLIVNNINIKTMNLKVSFVNLCTVIGEGLYTMKPNYIMITHRITRSVIYYIILYIKINYIIYIHKMNTVIYIKGKNNTRTL